MGLKRNSSSRSRRVFWVLRKRRKIGVYVTIEEGAIVLVMKMMVAVMVRAEEQGMVVVVMVEMVVGMVK